MIHYINVSGCDDSTTAFVELTEAQAAGVQLVADAINAASDGGCMPSMSFRPARASDYRESFND